MSRYLYFAGAVSGDGSDIANWSTDSSAYVPTVAPIDSTDTLSFGEYVDTILNPFSAFSGAVSADSVVITNSVVLDLANLTVVNATATSAGYATNLVVLGAVVISSSGNITCGFGSSTVLISLAGGSLTITDVWSSTASHTLTLNNDSGGGNDITAYGDLSIVTLSITTGANYSTFYGSGIGRLRWAGAAYGYDALALRLDNAALVIASSESFIVSNYSDLTSNLNIVAAANPVNVSIDPNASRSDLYVFLSRDVTSVINATIMSGICITAFTDGSDSGANANNVTVANGVDASFSGDYALMNLSFMGSNNDIRGGVQSSSVVHIRGSGVIFGGLNGFGFYSSEARIYNGASLVIGGSYIDDTSTVYRLMGPTAVFDLNGNSVSGTVIPYIAPKAQTAARALPSHLLHLGQV